MLRNPGLEGESIAVTQAPLRKPFLLTKTGDEDLYPWPWWEQALLLLASGWVSGSARHLPPPGGLSQLALGCPAQAGKQ